MVLYPLYALILCNFIIHIHTEEIDGPKFKYKVLTEVLSPDQSFTPEVENYENSCSGSDPKDQSCSTYEVYFKEETDVFFLDHNVLKIKSKDDFLNQGSFNLILAVKEIGQQSKDSDDTLELTIYIQEGVDQDEENYFIRKKRETLAASIPNYEFKIASSDPTRDEAATVKLGTLISYNFTMILGSTGGDHTNAIVEISTNIDPSLSACAGICNLKVGAIPSSVTAKDTVVVKYIDKISKHVHSAVVIDYGYMDVISDNSNFEITFDIVTVKCDQSPGSKVHASVGADLHDSELIWVASDPYIIDDPAQQSYNLQCDMTPPTTVKANGCEIIKVGCYVGHSSDDVIIDVLLAPNTMSQLDGISLCEPRLGDIGENFCIIDNVGRTTTFKQTIKSNDVRSIVEFGVVTNKGIDKVSPVDANKLTFGYLVCAKEEGNNFTVSTGISLGVNKIYVSQFNMMSTAAGSTSTTETTPDQREVKITSNEVEIKGTLGAKIRYQFSRNTYYPIEIKISAESDRVEVCSIQIIKSGANFFCPPDTSNCLVKVGDNYICNLGLVHSYDFCDSAECNEIEFLAGLIITDNALNTDGQTLVPTITMSSSLIAVDTVTLKDPALNTVPTAVLSNDVTWADWLVGGIMAGSVEIDFKNVKSVGQTSFTANSECEDSSTLKICKVDIESAGLNLPCPRGNINGAMKATVFNKSKDTLTDEDTGEIDLGMLCPAPWQSESEEEGIMKIQYVFKSTGTTVPSNSEQCNIGLGLKMNNDYLWVGLDSRDIKPYTAVKKDPVFRYEVMNLNSMVGVGGVAIVVARLIIQDQTISSYSIEASVTHNTNFGICGGKVFHVGANIPCYKEEDDLSETFTPDAEGISGTHKFEFTKIANIAKKPPLFDNYDSLNNFGIVYGVWVKADGGTNNINYDINDDGASISSPAVDLNIEAGELEPPTGYTLPIAEVYLAENETAYENAAMKLTLKLGVAPMESFRVNLSLIVPDKSSVCSMSVTYWGENYMCHVPAVGIAVTSNQMDISVELANHGFSQISDGNYVGISAIVKPHSTETGTFRVEIIPKVGSATQSTKQSIITLQTGTPPAGSGMDTVTPFTANTTTVTAGIREPVRIVMGVRLSEGSSAIKANITCPGSSGTSQCIVRKCKFWDAGENILCFNATAAREDIEATYTSTNGNIQQDSCSLDVGSLFVQSTSSDAEAYEVTFEIEVEPTDHKSNADSATFDVTLVIESSATTNAGPATTTITVDRTIASENKQQHEILLQVTPSKPMLANGDTVDLNLNIRHTNDSRYEQEKIAICCYIPPYFNVDSYKSSKDPTTPLHSYCIQSDDGFLFDEKWSVNITASLVKSKMMKIGEGMAELDIIIPCNLYCLHNNDGTNFAACSNMTYDKVKIEGNSCDDSLLSGLEDCQFYAPTARDSQSTANFVRISDANNVYVPMVGPNSFIPHISIDFGNYTKINRMVIKKHPSYSFIEKFTLQYSDEGIVWMGNQEIDITASYSGDEYNHSKPFQDKEIQFVRLVILKSSDVTKYTGVKLDFFGCWSDRISTIETCKSNNDVLYKDTTPGRHFVIDSTTNSIIICDLQHDFFSDKWKHHCYHSADGVVWSDLMIVECHGESSGKIYGSSLQSIFLLSDDGGSTWQPTTEDEKEAQTFTGKVDVILSDQANFETDNPNAEIAPWKATYNGIEKNGELVFKWN